MQTFAPIEEATEGRRQPKRPTYTSRHTATWAASLLALTLAGALIGSAAVAASAFASDGQVYAPHPTSTAMSGMGHGADSSDMSGMDHGSTGSSDSGAGTGADKHSWWPTASAEHEHGTGIDDAPGTDHGQHGSTAEAAPDRPLGLVLGSFGAGSAAVLAAGALMRRRDRSTASAKRGHLDARPTLT